MCAWATPTLFAKRAQPLELALGEDLDARVDLQPALAHGRSTTHAPRAQLGHKRRDDVLDAAVATGGTGSQGPAFMRTVGTHGR